MELELSEFRDVVISQFHLHQKTHLARMHARVARMHVCAHPRARTQEEKKKEEEEELKKEAKRRSTTVGTAAVSGSISRQHIASNT